MTMAYHFKDWGRIYENNKSRDVETLSYYCQPNKLVGEGLGITKMQPDGLELLGTLTFLKCVASTAQPPEWRGWFIRNGTVMDARRIAALAGIPVEKVTRALEFFSTFPMDWLVHEEWPGIKAAHRGQTAVTSAAHRGQTAVTSAAHRGHHAGRILSGLTDKGLTEDLKTVQGRERESPTFTELQASRTQAGALLAQIRELEARGKTLESEERADLRKKRRDLSALQKKQAAGDFAAVGEGKP